MIGYKVAKCGEKRAIVTLEIPEDAITNMNRSTIAVRQTAKYRANKVKVISIEDKEGNTYKIARSCFFDRDILYEVHKMVVCEDFDMTLENVCSSGIHFFLDRKVAEQYELEKIENGTLTSYHDNGGKFIEQSYVNGLKDGLFQRWEKSGQLIATNIYVKGLSHGPFKCFWPDGTVKQTGTYNNNKFNGNYKEYYSNGVLAIEKIYKDGVENKNLRKKYLPNGKRWTLWKDIKYTFMHNNPVLL